MKYHIIPIVPFNQNCLLVWCEITNDAAIVDPGGEIKKICKEIDKLKINVKKIFITHGHVDHVGGAIELRHYYDIPIIGPNKCDKFLLDNLSFQYRMLGINKNINNIVMTPDVWLENGNIIKIGYEVFKVLHCPGHSPGHVVFWNKIHKFIIMGDVLFKESIGRTDLPGGDFNILINSIKNKLFVLGNDIFFVPGHGLTSTIEYERLNNPFLK